jgi:hypothetical protein
MPTISGQNGQLTQQCCHPSPAVHATETALLAALIAEHKLLSRMLDYPGESNQIIALLQAHSGAARTLASWRAAVSISWAEFS